MMGANEDGFNYVNYKDLEETIQKLIKDCVKARELAYCPYSNFKVGAAVLTDSGATYTGCNVENASHSPTICAERTALVKAVSSGEMNFKAMAISAQLGDDRIISPCGLCRQFISEFSRNKNITIYLSTPDFKKICKTSIDSLLPLRFYL